MKKLARTSAAWMMMLALALAAGCRSADLRCKYQPGDVDRIRYSGDKSVKVWVEMPGKKTLESGDNQTQAQLVLRREVQSLEGTSAIMKVTIEEAQYSDSNKKTGPMRYSSTAAKTQSDWADEPALAGVSYSIKIADDSTVQEIIGLDKLREQLIKVQDRRRPVYQLLMDENIRRCHQCSFMIGSPAKINPGKTYAKYEEIPDPMVKAQAIKNTYTISEFSESEGELMVDITGVGEPMHILPKGIAEPPGPANPIITMIKTQGTMQQFDCSDNGSFDLTTGKIRQANRRLEALLLALGKDFNFGPRKDSDPEAQGEMYWQIKMDGKYELLK